MKYYVETNDEKFAMQLNNFATNIVIYAGLFGLTADDLSNANKDAAFFTWAIAGAKKYEDTKKGWTGFKSILRQGEPNLQNNDPPQTPNLEPVAATVSPGVQFRFTSLANRIKANPNYTYAIGQILGIEVTSRARVAFENVQPLLKLVMRGGRVNLDWKKGMYSGIVIEKDSGDGFVVFDKDTRPNFVDPTPLPEPGTSAVWKYRAMYLYNDDRVGDWSDVATITVGG